MIGPPDKFELAHIALSEFDVACQQGDPTQICLAKDKLADALLKCGLTLRDMDRAVARLQIAIGYKPEDDARPFKYRVVYRYYSNQPPDVVSGFGSREISRDRPIDTSFADVQYVEDALAELVKGVLRKNGAVSDKAIETVEVIILNWERIGTHRDRFKAFLGRLFK